MVEAHRDAHRLARREEAAQTDRHWVRLTRCCNNRCVFCLDVEAQDGQVLPAEEVGQDIRRGIALGRSKRLVLSGGEPTIHPDFVSLVAEGVAAGYERVQVVTNGRMLSDPALLGAALDAGLGEVTISLHGHRAELHDRIVGVPGAFAQAIRALRAALADGRPIVNVDVVACRQNVEHLEEIVALCLRLGVHEIDLLQVQPAGRAVEPGSRALYSVEDSLEPLRRVFTLGRRPDLFLWTNRFPVNHLEGFEELIQDPHKLVDEVRGRMEHIEALVRSATPLPCRGERCRACFLAPLCDHLHDYARRIAEADFDEVLLDLREGAPPLPLPEGLAVGVTRCRVIAHDLEQTRGLAEGSLPGTSVSLWLESPRGLEGGAIEVAGLPVTRLGGEAAHVLEAALAAAVEEIEVAPARSNEVWLGEHSAMESPRLVVRLAPRERLSECRDEDLSPARLAELLAESKAFVEDLPPCLSGGRPVRWTSPPLEPESTGGVAGAVEGELLARRFAASRYRARSVRCDSCADGPSCQGFHVQRLRAFGLAVLEPRS